MDHELHKLQIACAYLFSPIHARDNAFIVSLDRNMIKKAFREKAKLYHPDLHGNETEEMILKRKERFIKIKKSYEYLSQRVHDDRPTDVKQPENKPQKRPVVIAVGGAKGGIGKSLVTANLSVSLSNKGLKTVAVDLDLGGANLHLYLGKTRIKKNINDFFDKKELAISDIMEKTDFGPYLIGGDSGRLGAGNIPFARKLKLLKAIKTIDADCVVIDLGGDTSYNMLDFFLAADQGVVMTTCDPASYLDAYTFIKVALYRKLNRLFGPESDYSGETTGVLKNLIQDMTLPQNGRGVSDMNVFRAKIKQECPSGLGIVNQAISGFFPHIIVNKTNDANAALEPVKRIQQVAKQNLTIDVNHLCNLPFMTDIERSARTLVPWVSTDSNGSFALLLDGLSKTLLSNIIL
ncbi:putative heat shock protein related to DnaJ [Desulfobacula toluolica Tol2]|uniref:Putative heat shock protein related to DnaJ n=2 Tax=Desulfobacula toluolica TaxID=28223 RepID=K0NIA4_DESTT|nr:putative heat shock protein related to DnaJ [Desulfobacula toluolica Tol2]